MKRLLACCTIVLFVLLPAAAFARPALWVVKDADTTIYLFGTVHVLAKDTSWRDPTLDRALANSRTLYVELVDDDAANVAALVLRLGMDFTHSLTDQLSAGDAHRLRLMANKLGVPGGIRTLNVMRPWLAALTLALAPLKQAGLDPEYGVDRQLRAQMVAAGKQVKGLETAEEQIRLLADMPRRVELDLLHSTMREADKGTLPLDQLIAAWKTGDVDAIARIATDDMRKRQPRLYQTMLVQRNQAWAMTIATLLDQPGSIFIAVGAAHLAGPDSVQVQLRKRGIDAARQ